MTRVGFVGLGIMGSPMAVNMVRAGHEVVGHNRSPGKADALVEAGGSSADSVPEAVRDAEVVCVMVTDTPDVRDVLLGEEGVLASVAPGTVVVDFSTIRPDVTLELAAAARDAGVRLLDAPVSGGQVGARDGVLSVMVGGEEDVVQEVRPLLEVVGRTVVHVGPNGAGQTVKAANQLLVAAHLQALGEAVVFLDAYGVDLAPALRVLGGGLAGSAVLEQKRDNVLEQSFEPGFTLALHDKDMGILVAAAREKGVVVPLGALAAQLVASAVAVGDGRLDHSALLRGVQRLSGTLPALEPGADGAAAAPAG